MTFLDRAIATIAPDWALRRLKARAGLRALSHYDAATQGRRGKSFTSTPADADAAAARRDLVAWRARDMVRNAPYAARAKQVIRANVVGRGVVPSIKVPANNTALSDQWQALLERHFETTDCDAHGRHTLYGLQGLICETVVESGECLVVRRRRPVGRGLALPWQIEVLEPDHLSDLYDGPMDDGTEVAYGIHLDGEGRRLGYWLRQEHPGASRRWGAKIDNRPTYLPAADVLHVYRQDRPGQLRGISWFAPVTLALQDMHDLQDAYLLRQKIAACFVAFRRRDDETHSEDAPSRVAKKLQPGAIEELAPGEDMEFASPPGVDGFEEFAQMVLRSVASGLGITYGALSGDLRGVNFTSGRMGRLEMDRNVETWQQSIMIDQVCAGVARWVRETWGTVPGHAARFPTDARLQWTPPARQIVDPSRENKALIEAISGGLVSRPHALRARGFDPSKVNEEIAEDAQDRAARGITLSWEQQGGAPSRPEEIADE